MLTKRRHGSPPCLPDLGRDLPQHPSFRLLHFQSFATHNQLVISSSYRHAGMVLVLMLCKILTVSQFRTESPGRIVFICFVVTHVGPRFEPRVTLRVTDVPKVRWLPYSAQWFIYLLLIRLCLPEEYGVRKVIYNTMKSHASRINEFLSRSSPEPSGSCLDTGSSISRVADELQKLIRLFDDVLLEGYSDDHDTLFLPDQAGHNPTCQYCGAPLFLSYFNCAGVCFNLEIEPHGDISINVCGACYVEGRFCACRAMTPKRLHDFSNLLRERNDAANTLSNYLAPRSVQTDDLGEISER